MFNNQVYASNNRSLYKIIDNNLQLQKNYPQAIRSLKASEEFLALATQRYVYVIDTNDAEKLNYVTNTNQPFYYNLNAAYFEDNTLFGFQTKTLIGLRADYEVNDNLTVGGTFLNLFERPFTQKVNIGDDPINNKIYGFIN